MCYYTTVLKNNPADKEDLKMKKILAMILAAAMVFALCACGQSSAPAATEAPAALENGWNVVSVDTQSKALMEVAAGTSDAAIIDLLMAGAMIGEGTSYPDMKLGDELTTEEYGVGCRKGSDLADFINSVFAETYADGTMLEIAKSATLMTAMLPTSRTRAPSSSASPISSRWTTRMRTANGSALTLTWQSSSQRSSALR